MAITRPPPSQAENTETQPPVGQLVSLALPLYALDAACADPRFPRVVGEWAVGCGPTGAVDRAVHLPSRRTVTLPTALTHPCADDRQLWAPGQPDARVLLGPVEPSLAPAPRLTSPAGPCGISGDRVAVQDAEGLRVGDAEGPWTRLDTVPYGGAPLAVTQELVAWVAAIGDGQPQVWCWAGAAAPQPLGAVGSRHVIAAAGRLAWVEPTAVVIWDPTTQVAHRSPAQTGFSAGLGFDGEVACWEERGAHDVDLRCSDGRRITGPGHQRGPSVSGRYLLYNNNGHVFLAEQEHSE